MAADQLEDLPVGMAAVATDSSELRTINGLAAAALGTKAEDAVGRRLDELVATEDRPVVAALVASDADATAPSDRPSSVVRLVDAPRWVELRVGGLTSDGQRLVGMRDATAEVRTAALLRESVESAVVVDDLGERAWGPIGRMYRDTTSSPPGSIADIVHPEDLASALDVWHRVREGAPDGHVRLRMKYPTLDRWGLASLEMLDRRQVPDVGGMVVVVHHHQEKQDGRSSAGPPGAYLSVAEAAPVGIILMGPQGFAMYFNEASRRLVPGVGAADDGGFDRDWVGRVRDEEREEVQRWVATTLDAQRSSSRVVCFGDDDAPTWLLVTLAPRIAKDRIIGYVATLQDISGEVRTRQELEATRDELQHLATHDPLTGVGNRALLDDALGATGGPGAPLAIIVCDLDGFKAINDRFGHHVGDQVLVSVADRLRGAVRPDDVVVRLGGDEFLVVATGTTEAELAVLAGRVHDALTGPVSLSEHTVEVGVSVGWAAQAADESLDDLLQRADVAMYGAKAAGRRHGRAPR